MSKYFDVITDKSNLTHNVGEKLVVCDEFMYLSSKILSQCTFLQNLIQQIIYTTHGKEIFGSKKTLKKFPNPKSRFDFICSFDYHNNDEIVSRVFEYSRGLFEEIYILRNILAHEVWSSSEEFRGSVLFSSLDENSRLLMASGRIWHMPDTTPQETYDAAIRFIGKIKIITRNHLDIAIRDINICAWSLMHINNILGEDDPDRRADARKAFFVFKGTSHLFDNDHASSEFVKFKSYKQKSIN